MLKRTLLASAALIHAFPVGALDLQSTTVPGRTVPSLSNGEIAINRADKSLFFKNVDGTIGIGSLLNAVAAGRKAVEKGDGGDLTQPTGAAYVRTLAERGADVRNLLDEIPPALRPAVLDGTSTTDLSQYVQAAVNRCVKACVLYVPAGLYPARSVKVHGAMSIVGAGKGKTIFKQVGAKGEAVFWTPGDAGMTYDLEFASFTLDVNGVDTGIRALDVERFTARDLLVKNVWTWGIHVGVTEATAQANEKRNRYITIKDNEFDGIVRTLEQILVYNAADVLIADNRFRNGPAESIGVGIYQFVDRITVSRNVFDNLQIGSYYSITVNNLSYTDNFFINNGFGIRGANPSDHGTFGETSVRGLKVSGGGFFRNKKIALELGAVSGAIVDSVDFGHNENNTISIHPGNTQDGFTINFPPTATKFSNLNIYNNNTSGTQYQLHAPILINSGATGDLNMTMEGVNVWDDQATPTQLNAIAINGPGVRNNVNIYGGSLRAYNGGATFTLLSGATLANWNLYGVGNVNNTPPGVTDVTAALAGKANLSGATFSGGVNVRGPGSPGYVGMVGGSATTTGFLEFRAADGTRLGYIGNGTASSIPIFAEVGAFNFNIAPKVGGNDVWHPGNSTPNIVTATAEPVPANIPTGRCVDWSNTTTGTIKRFCNVGGVLKSIAYQ